MNEIIKIALVSDLHYAAAPNPACSKRRGEQIPKLLSEFVRQCNQEIHPDLVLCGGDLINAPMEADAANLTADVAGIFSRLETPCLVIRGNHDLPPEKFARFFPFQEVLDAGFVRILSFDDPESPGFNAVRTEAASAKTDRYLRDWEGIAFSFQHTPLLPAGICPYHYENAEIILAGLRKHNCRGTLSGHYHAGIPLFAENRLQFFVQSALCEAPFAFSVLYVSEAGIQKIESRRCR